MSRGLDIKGKEYTLCDERSSSRQKQQPKDHLVQPREASEARVARRESQVMLWDQRSDAGRRPPGVSGPTSDSLRSP